MFKLALIGTAAGLAGGFLGGWTVHGWRDGAAQTKALVRTVTIVQHDAQAAVKVATQVQAGQDRVRYVTQTITKEVHDAVPPAADPVLGYGFVRLWNAAAYDVSPSAAPPGEPDDAASGVKASDALGNAVDNFGAANACFVQLKGWQDWWADVSKVR